MKQDNCSSCSSLPPLESSNDTKIVTIGAESVPGLEHTDGQNKFLLERLLESIRQAAEQAKLGQNDGGAPEPDPQHPQDIVGPEF